MSWKGIQSKAELGQKEIAFLQIRYIHRTHYTRFLTQRHYADQ